MKSEARQGRVRHVAESRTPAAEERSSGDKLRVFGY